MSETVLILGATSGIGRAICHELARRGCRLLIAARDAETLAAMAADLRIRYDAAVDTETFDALAFSEHPAFFQRCVDRLDGGPDGVILCFGYLTDQVETQVDFEAARRTIDVNFTAAVSLLGTAANYFEARDRGYIAAISSVAGDRGRQSNYTYGAAKAGLSAWLDGLRNRLYHRGVHVLSVKPGFVDTAMIQGRVNPASPLVASPERVARDIVRAISRRRNTLYTPWFWWAVMIVIRLLPECVFKRLRL